MSRHGWQAAVLVIGALAGLAQAQTQLEWKLKEGDKFYLETSDTSKQTMILMGKPIPQEFETTSVDSYKVLENAADQTIVLEKEVESIKVKASGQEVEKAAQMYQRVKGAIFTLTLDPRNNIVIRMRGVASFVRKAFADDSAMAAILNEDSVRHEQQNILVGFLPGKPVTKGDKWTRKSIIPFGPIGHFSADGEFTYQGKCTLNNHEVDKIDATWTLTYVPPKHRTGLLILITKGDFKDLTANGTYFFDAGRGTLVQLERKYHMKGTITMSALPPAPEQSMNMEMEIDQTSMIRLIDAPPASK